MVTENHEIDQEAGQAMMKERSISEHLKPHSILLGKDGGSASVEFMFSFILLLWMCLGYIDVVFQGYNGLIIDFGSYMGARGYIVDKVGGTKWREGAEKIANGTMLPTQKTAYLKSGKVILEVTNKEMLRSGIIYGTKREGTLLIGNSLGDPEDSFEGDNAP